MLRLRANASAAGALAAAWLLAGPARAGGFTSDGSFVFDAGAVATFDFEDAVQLDDGGGAAVSADDDALSGSHVITLSPFAGTDIVLDFPKKSRTYRISVWIRGSETVSDLEVSYSDRVDEITTLYPTGRVTSDDWVELANEHVPIDGNRALRVALGLFSPNGSAIDAIELTPDGDEVPGGAECNGVADASACGAHEACVWGRCRSVSGWVPPIPEDRDDVTDYLEARLDLLFGPYLERTIDLPNAKIAIEQMRSAKDPWSYWNGFLLAVRRLHDGHTTTSSLADFVLENPKPLSICFLEGDADLSHGAAPKDPLYLDVIVSHVGGDHNLGLGPGDRLVHVDGQHPIAWARSLTSVHWGMPATSNHRTYAELASALRGLISRYAGSIGVVRCNAALGTCGALETISITELAADPPGTPVDSVGCDNRPLRHLAAAPPNHGGGFTMDIVKESNTAEKVYGMEWESLYTNGQDELASAFKSAIATWKADARGVILDHRTGTGGTILGPQILWSFAVPKHVSDFYLDRQRGEDEQPTIAGGQAIFEQALAQNLVAYAGAIDAVTDVPVALLVTEDVSASDWLPLGMKGASPKVKIFGPFETNGGFSTRYSFGYWLGMSYVAAVGDTFVPDGSTHNGTGVTPDVIVLPKQSDLLSGKDSVYEAALAWVRQELKP